MPQVAAPQKGAVLPSSAGICEFLGTWRYDATSTYQLSKAGPTGSLRFEELHDDGRLVSGVLEKQGPWLQGSLTFVDSQEECGMLRLRLLQGGLIISNLQP